MQGNRLRCDDPLSAPGAAGGDGEPAGAGGVERLGVELRVDAVLGTRRDVAIFAAMTARIAVVDVVRRGPVLW